MSDYCDIFRCDGYLEFLNHQHDHEENDVLKQNKRPIPSNLFIFDTRWFEQIGIVDSDVESSNKNSTVSDVKEKTEAQGDNTSNNDDLHDGNKALVLAPPRKILKALEDKMALEQSGQFVVGANLDSDVPDLVRDPLRILPSEAESKKDSPMRQSSLFYRETFSKMSSTFLEGTRKRQVNLFWTGNGNDEHDNSNQENLHKNNKASVIDGFITFFQFMWQCVGEYERFMQNHNLLPAYKFTILRHQPSRFKNKFEEDEQLRFHSASSIDEDSYFEGTSEPCDTKDMELKHQSCVVRIFYI